MLVTALVFGSDRVPSGTNVEGVDIGGLDREPAISLLSQALDRRANQELRVKVNGQRLTVTPAGFGLAADPATIVDHVRTRWWNPLDVRRTLLGGGSESPVVVIDNAALEAGIAKLSGQIDAPMREPRVTFDGLTPAVRGGSGGTVIDRPAAAAALASAFLSPDRTLALPTTQANPATPDSEAERVAREVAPLAVAEPVTINVGGTSISAAPADIAKSLTFEVRDGAFAPRIAGGVLHDQLAHELAAVETPVKNATWDTSGEKAVVIPSAPGQEVTNSDLAGAVESVLAKQGGPERTVSVAITQRQPKLTTEQAEALGVTDKLSSFTQEFDYAPYRVNNIGLAAKAINGTVVAPGEVFSMNDTVGERTAERGFMKGFVVNGDGSFGEALGGGVSTATTAVWTAAFFAGLEKIEQSAHLIYISRYQPGLEATVAWGQIDLKLKNDTDHAILIEAESGNNGITVTMWGKKKYDDIQAKSGKKENITQPGDQVKSGPDCRASGGIPGFDIVVHRLFYQDGNVVKDEPMSTHYIPQPVTRCTNPAAPPP